MQVRIVTPPEAEAITLAEAKAHLKVKHATEDGLITSLIETARQHLEGLTAQDGILGRAIMQQTVEATFDGFPRCGYIDLPRPPLVDVEAVTYLDADGEEQTLDEALYTVETGRLVGRIRRRAGASWPVTSADPDSVTVTYVAGYGAVGGTEEAPVVTGVPRPIVQAMLMLIGHWYTSKTPISVAGRTSEAYAVEALLAPFRINRAL